MAFYQFSVPTKILCDEGMAVNFAHECAQLGIERLFVVTDKGVQKAGLIAPIVNALKAGGITITGIFDSVPPDSSVGVVTDCAALAKSAQTQGFLAIGGGSVMDTAKGANILFTLGGNLKDDYAGAQTINQKLSPLIAIPTTAGTGSEVTEAMVIYDEETQTKLSFVDFHLLPTLAVLDPTLTLGLPPLLTAATGLDALTHAVEAVYSVQHNAVSDALALHAIRLIDKHLIKAVTGGKDLKARTAMLTAANLAGIAFNHSMVGVVHAVAHSVGAVARVHHGTANGIFLPYGLEYNLPACADRIALMAPSFSIEMRGMPETEAKAVIANIRILLKNLSEACRFPLSYQEVHVHREDLKKIATLACDDGASFYNPRPLEMEALLPFLERAYEGC